MKKLVLSLALVAMATFACGASAVIDEIKKIDDIAAYHVPRFLIQNVLGMSDIIRDVIPGTQITALTDVESLDFITVHKRGARKKARKQLEKLAQDRSYEVIMQAKKDKQRQTVVYGLPLSANDYKELIIVVDEDDNITIIDVKGSINVDQLSRLTPDSAEL